jgi:hypothetical protein
VRHRTLESKLGRWTKRDPLGYIDGSGLQQYARSAPKRLVDASGLSPFASPFGGLPSAEGPAPYLPSPTAAPFNDHFYTPSGPTAQICVDGLRGVLPPPPPGCAAEYLSALTWCCSMNRNDHSRSLACAQAALQISMPECVQSQPLPPGAAPPSWSDCLWDCHLSHYGQCVDELKSCFAGVVDRALWDVGSCLGACLVGPCNFKAFPNPLLIPKCKACLAICGSGAAFCLARFNVCGMSGVATCALTCAMY